MWSLCIIKLMFYILLFLILALPGGLLPPREKQKKKKAEGLLTDDEFVQLKKRKAELEIEQLEDNIQLQKEKANLEIELMQAQISETNSRSAFFEALTKFPFLTNVAVYTGFKVTSTEYILLFNHFKFY